MYRIFWAIILLSNLCVFSQERIRNYPYNYTSIKEILTLLEKKHQIKFSYIDALLENKTVSKDFKIQDLPLQEQLKILEQLIHLKFEYTGEDLVIIRSFSNQDLISVCARALDQEQQSIRELIVEYDHSWQYINADENGFFVLENIPATAELKIRDQENALFKVNALDIIQTSQCKTIFLIEEIETLDEIVIQEYLTTGIILTNKAIKIKLKELGALPGLTEPDILKSVQLSPGVNSPLETASGVYVRGSAPHQNLVLWNGIKTYNQGHFFGILSAFNPYVAKETNFIKSGTSARYGDRIASTIDIKSDDEVVSEFTGSAGFNMLNADITVGIPIIEDKLSLQISGRRSFTDMLQTFTYNQLSKRVFQNTEIENNNGLDEGDNDFFFADYNFNIIGKISDKDELRFDAIYATNDLDFNVTDETITLTDQLQTDNEGISLQWNRSWNPKLKHTLKGYYSKYLLDYRFITSNDNLIASNNIKLNRIRDFGIELDWEYKLSEYKKIIAGYHLSNNATQYSFRNETPSILLILDQDDRKINTQSLYGEFQYTNPKQLHVSLGLRYNSYDELGRSLIEPRLFMSKDVSKNLKIKGSLEFKSQVINRLRESVVSDLTLENEVWRLSDGMDFPVVRSAQMTLGTNYKKKSFFIDIDGYYKQIDGLTTLTSGFINPVDNSFHIGESKTYGVDVFVKKSFNGYKTWASYSFINTRNRFDTINDEEFFPGNWNIEHTFKWTHSYTYNNFQFSLGWMWHSGKPFTELEDISEDGENPILSYVEINNNNLPSYHRMDFSALYDFQWSKTKNIKYQVGVSLLNVYNRVNLLNKEFTVTPSVEQSVVSREIYSLGITPNISFRMNW